MTFFLLLRLYFEGSIFICAFLYRQHPCAAYLKIIIQWKHYQKNLTLYQETIIIN
jgi:hypothetical protein